MFELTGRARATGFSGPDAIEIGGGGPAGPSDTRRAVLPRDGAAALLRFAKACELGDGKGCQNAGLVSKDGVAGAKADFDRAVGFFDKACALGQPNGCFWMGIIRGNFDGNRGNLLLASLAQL